MLRLFFMYCFIYILTFRGYIKMGLLFCTIFSLQTFIVSSLSQFEGISNYVFVGKQ